MLWVSAHDFVLVSNCSPSLTSGNSCCGSNCQSPSLWVLPSSAFFPPPLFLLSSFPHSPQSLSPYSLPLFFPILSLPLVLFSLFIPNSGFKRSSKFTVCISFSIPKVSYFSVVPHMCLWESGLEEPSTPVCTLVFQEVTPWLWCIRQLTFSWLL